ncbi:hypothetical protein PA25_05440 [Pseudoalteromonas sp. A25]|uniref:hypothetical protein n=1 Tax=Pseudoalteromonas sp. A25 TaxID=116092 RepID=UPI001261284E|nr:hypothetical protein [Pseudoalteromonas sp. A25]BBN80559.1 hypothetical protein PA25_05440 [Pseudoalteromonas sp. A25]
MFKPISLILVAFAVLIALTGQAMAVATMPCETSLTNHQSMMEMEHGQTKSTMDCCDTQCTCPASACLSVVYLDNEHLPAFEYQIAEPRLHLLPQSPHAVTASLYRPPIIA